MRLVAALLLPPCGPLALAALGAFLYGRKRKLGLWLLGAGLGALALLSLPCASALLQRSLQWHAPLAPEERPLGPEAVVVLGAGLETYAPEYPRGATAGALSLERARYGALLAARMDLPLTVCGGALEPRAPALAVLVADFVQGELALRQRVFVDERSRTTWENAVEARALLAPEGLEHILLVTHAFHMPRAVHAFERVGFAVTPAPMGLRSPPRPRLRDFLPSAHALEESTLALHEWLGLAWYKAAGALGRANP
jgi:uncharacterized SAM-binding protein YcdF (DUF218 family)